MAFDCFHSGQHWHQRKNHGGDGLTTQIQGGGRVHQTRRPSAKWAVSTTSSKGLATKPFDRTVPVCWIWNVSLGPLLTKHKDQRESGVVWSPNTEHTRFLNCQIIGNNAGASAINNHLAILLDKERSSERRQRSTYRRTSQKPPIAKLAIRSSKTGASRAQSPLGNYSNQVWEVRGCINIFWHSACSVAKSLGQSALRRTKELASLTLSWLNHPCLLTNTLNMQSARICWYILIAHRWGSLLCITLNIWVMCWASSDPHLWAMLDNSLTLDWYCVRTTRVALQYQSPARELSCTYHGTRVILKLLPVMFGQVGRVFFTCQWLLCHSVAQLSSGHRRHDPLAQTWRKGVLVSPSYTEPIEFCQPRTVWTSGGKFSKQDVFLRIMVLDTTHWGICQLPIVWMSGGVFSKQGWCKRVVFVQIPCWGHVSLVLEG